MIMTRPEKYRTNLRGNLAMFESIDGTCLTPKEISYLIRVAELNSILEIPPKKASDFSKNLMVKITSASCSDVFLCKSICSNSICIKHKFESIPSPGFSDESLEMKQHSRHQHERLIFQNVVHSMQIRKHSALQDLFLLRVKLLLSDDVGFQQFMVFLQ